MSCSWLYILNYMTVSTAFKRNQKFDRWSLEKVKERKKNESGWNHLHSKFAYIVGKKKSDDIWYIVACRKLTIIYNR